MNRKCILFTCRDGRRMAGVHGVAPPFHSTLAPDS